jgi:AcrR family transcriptional regulator
MSTRIVSGKKFVRVRGEVAMKARDRILDAARTVFNAEGVSALSALDIATALGMSPGHLYYHFKGKGEIARALAGAHEKALLDLLNEARKAALVPSEEGEPPLKALWIQLAVLADEIEAHRFLYEEIFVLARADTQLAGVFRRIRGELRAVLDTLLASLHPALAPTARKALASYLAQGLMFNGAEAALSAQNSSTAERAASVAEGLAIAATALAEGPTSAKRAKRPPR